MIGQTLGLLRSFFIYYRPALCIIDVEGYELKVLHGLSRPLPALSFEVIAAAKKSGLDCLDALNQLAVYEFNYAAGESHCLHFERWLTPLEMVDFVHKMESGSGDVYGRRLNN
ncbi:MAG: hypothetical protein GY796_27290 [Chloroflexi bacterium]|nr:hypothetical protein [Chloroflexota bacterium]